MTEDANDAGAVDNMAASNSPATETTTRPWYRPRWRPLLLRLHRWTSFASLLLVTAFFVSGVIVMYSDDMIRLDQSEAYHSTDTGHTATLTEVLDAATEATPGNITWAISRDRNVFIVFQLDEEYNSVYTFVDGGTGKVNATLTEQQLDSKGWPWLRRMAWNVHVCALSCEGMPWHLKFMEGKVPLLGWRWKTTALMATGLATLFLAVSGIVMWWPGLRRWKRGFRLRRNSLTAFAVDSHRLFGFLAFGWFLMWGITGAIFALPKDSDDLWHNLTGAHPAIPELDMQAMETYATPGTGPEVSLAEAEKIALAAVPDSKFVNVILALPDNELGLPANYYEFQLADTHLDPRGFAPYGGGQNAVTVGLHGEPTLRTDDGLATTLWSGYRLGLHDGWMVNPWWRLIWLLFGLSPVLFALTGIFMWWRRRRNRGLREEQGEAAQLEAAELSSHAEETLDEDVPPRV